MKAFLLAAGTGSRLRPLTLKTPKCLLPISGVPLLEIWLRRLEKMSVSEVFINTHHLPGLVEEFLQNYQTDMRIITGYEETLLGSAGTLNKHRDFVDGEKAFFVIYADNLTNAFIDGLWTFHEKHNGTATIGLFHTPTPTQCGIVVMNETQKIIAFTEKPEKPKSDLAFAGIMVASSDLFDVIPYHYPSDLGFEVLPRLTGKMYGIVLDGLFIDIGTQARYEEAQRLWSNQSINQAVYEGRR
jgi:mannose-1-phosphate guanylyltransferase